MSDPRINTIPIVIRVKVQCYKWFQCLNVTYDQSVQQSCKSCTNKSSLAPKLTLVCQLTISLESVIHVCVGMVWMSSTTSEEAQGYSTSTHRVSLYLGHQGVSVLSNNLHHPPSFINHKSVGDEAVKVMKSGFYPFSL